MTVDLCSLFVGNGETTPRALLAPSKQYSVKYMNPNAQLIEEAAKLNPTALVELFTLDLSSLGVAQPINFYAGMSATGQSVKFKGETFVPFPVVAKGFEQRTQGALPRPTISFANVNGYFSSLAIELDDIIGAKLTRRRTFARFLDDQWSDPNNEAPEFPPDTFTIVQKKTENKLLITFEMSSALDVDGIRLPRRQVLSQTCTFIYRSGVSCNYSGCRVVSNLQGAIPTLMTRYRGSWDGAHKDYYQNDGVMFPEFEGTPLGVPTLYRMKAINLKASNANLAPSIDTANWEVDQIDYGQWNSGTVYPPKSVVWVLVKNIRYYYFQKHTEPVAGAAFRPPNPIYWFADMCNRTALACKQRYDPDSLNQPIPFGGFPGTSALPEA